MKFITSFIVLTVFLNFYGVSQFDNLSYEIRNQTSTESYFLKAQVNGEWIVFDNSEQLSANFGPYIDNVYDGVISASNINEEDHSILNSISIIIRQKGQIGVGSYSGGQQFEYGFKGITLAYMEASTSTMYLTDTNNPKSFLKINEFTDTVVKGSFSGELIHPINKEKISVTNGEFHIKNSTY